MVLFSPISVKGEEQHWEQRVLAFTESSDFRPHEHKVERVKRILTTGCITESSDFRPHEHKVERVKRILTTGCITVW
jgi:hypothetical protein